MLAINCVLFHGWNCSHFCHQSFWLGSFRIFPSVWVWCFVFQVFPSFLVLWNTPDLSHFLPAARLLEAAISPRSSSSWYWWEMSEARIQAFGVLVGINVSLLMGPLSWESRETAMCTLSCVCTYICKYFSMWASVPVVKLNVSSSWSLQLPYITTLVTPMPSSGFLLMLAPAVRAMTPLLTSTCFIVQFQCTCIAVSEFLACTSMWNCVTRGQYSIQFICLLSYRRNSFQSHLGQLLLLLLFSH